MPLAIRVAKGKKIPVVGDFHENFAEQVKLYYWANTFLGKILINKKKWEFLQKDCVKKLDRIIVVADETINYFSKKYKVAQEKFTVVDNSIDIEQFEKSGINQQLDEELKTKYKDNVVFGYTGCVLPNRGLQHFIKILPLFKQTNIKMVIVGKGRFSRVLKNMISQDKIDNMVDWYDWQPFQNLITFTSNFDIGITRLEKNLQNDYTTPNKVFQYMYMKIPVLTADSLPMLRIVGKTESGLVFKSGNYAELKECVKNLIANKQLRENMGANGRKAVLGKYNWEETSKNLIKLYEEIK
jgi:glycosyltransferase involved in cell wall biosynthesis